MQFSSLKINDEIDIKYYLYVKEVKSDVLILSFPGVGDFGLNFSIGYLLTLKQFDVNCLFFSASEETVDTKFCFYKKTNEVEIAIKSLIDKCIKELNIKSVIVLGSSLGGYCSLYYGLKYNYDIFAGSPPYKFKSSLLSAGDNSKKSSEWLNMQLPQLIKKYGSNYSGRMFLCFGQGESNWLDSDKGQKLISDLNNSKVKYTMELFPFTNHRSLHKLFPNIIKSVLPILIDKNADMNSIHNISNSSDFSVILSLQNRLAGISKLISSADISSMNPNYEISGVRHISKKEEQTEMRDFAYICAGMYYDPKLKEPIYIKDNGGFWNLDNSGVDEYFGLQDEFMDLYSRHQDRKELFQWCLNNTKEWLTFSNYYKKVNKPSAKKYLNRFHYFLSLLCTLSDRTEIENALLRFIKSDLVNALSQPVLQDSVLRYDVFIALLHYAKLFSDNTEFYNKLMVEITEYINELNAYSFDDNGVCITGHCKIHCLLTDLLQLSYLFINENNIKSSLGFGRFNALYKKALMFSNYLVKPSGYIPSLGGTPIDISNYTCNSGVVKEGNYIKPNSDIAILSDDLSFLTVGTGHCFRSKVIHKDLLSFTWMYDKLPIMVDPGEGTKDVLEYSCSQMAHCSFFCNDMDYSVPLYSDWTSMKSYKEQDDYVVISMCHNLYDSVLIKRNLIWVKPNALVLVDEASSEEAHEYTQNFITKNYKYISGKDNHAVNVKIDSNHELHISQLLSDGNKLKLEFFNGTSSVKNIDKYRGSLIKKSSSLEKGLNVAYSAKTKKIRLVTLLEMNSSLQDVHSKEKHILSCAVKDDSLILKMKNKDLIIENIFNNNLLEDEIF